MRAGHVRHAATNRSRVCACATRCSRRHPLLSGAQLSRSLVTTTARSPLSVRSIFHVGFVVSDLDASLRFYCEGLGLELRHRQLQNNAYTSSLVGYPDATLEVAQLRFSDAAPPPSGHVIELI